MVGEKITVKVMGERPCDSLAVRAKVHMENGCPMAPQVEGCDESDLILWLALRPRHHLVL